MKVYCGQKKLDHINIVFIFFNNKNEKKEKELLHFRSMKHEKN